MSDKNYAPVETVVREEQFNCEVLQSKLNGNKINVLLLFPNGKTAISSVEYNGLTDIVTVITDKNKKPTAKATVQLIHTSGYYKLDIDREIRTYDKYGEHINYPEIWVKPTHHFKITIDELYLKRESFVK